ncbi:MAG: YbaN family protein [Coriobacteriales bacterium]|jgi:uncharacterized membrane protein YbaN (DUF454 family)|nr:YbaN family protein [Coriobacteriales bacterium]
MPRDTRTDGHGTPSPETSASAARRLSSKAARVGFLFLGVLALALGTVGVVVPLLPTTPFYLLAVFCLARSSRRLHDWFASTALYRRYLETYLRGQGMTIRTKLSVFVSVTVLLGVSVFFTWGNAIPFTVVLVVWVVHALYLFLKVKTLKAKPSGPVATHSSPTHPAPSAQEDSRPSQ